MKAISMMLILSLFAMACGGGSTGSDSGGDIADLSSQEQAELVAAALSEDQGGVADDIAIVTEAAEGTPQPQTQSPNAVYNYSVSVTIDFYDAMDNLQDNYDSETTDRIDYSSQILGEITEGEGYFTDLSIDNRSDFTVDDILSRTVWINGTHTNNSSYSRITYVTEAEVHFELDCEVIVTDVTVDLDAADTFPESGTIEGTLSGSYERNGPFGRYTSTFSFHFIATYIGDNTAEVELDDGTVFIIQLASGSVQFVE